MNIWKWYTLLVVATIFTFGCAVNGMNHGDRGRIGIAHGHYNVSGAARTREGYRTRPIRDDIDSRRLALKSGKGQYDEVRFLLERKRHIHMISDSSGDIPALRNACEGGHVDVLRLLLEYYFRHNQKEIKQNLLESSLYLRGLLNIVIWAHKDNVWNLNQDCRLKHGQVLGIAELLVQYGADITDVDFMGYTPINSLSSISFPTRKKMMSTMLLLIRSKRSSY